jgi:nucleoside-diphosphate-sugar epimerase
VDKLKALVTGSNGFIGSHLVEYLLSVNYEVFCFIRPESNLRWIKNLRVQFIHGDCRDKNSLYDAVKDKDYIFHLAGKIKALDWDTYYDANYIGTKNLVEACVEACPGLKRFVHISSIAAAGPSVKGKLKSEEDACNPINDYGKSKLMGEEAVARYSNKLPIVIVRPPNVLGPREWDFFSTVKIISKRIKPLLGNGDNQTSICFVQDLVKGIVMAATNKNAVGNTYYITDGNTYSWRKITDTIVKELGLSKFIIPLPHHCILILALIIQILMRIKRSETMISPRRIIQLRHLYWIYDSSKAERELGFRPAISLEEGIKISISWYREQNLPYSM